MKPLRVSKMLLALAALAFLLCSPALTQEPAKPEKPWLGKHADGRELTRAGLDEILQKHSLWLESEGNEERKGKRADLRNANLSGANLSMAVLNETNLSEADLSNANLSRALLVAANLSGAKLGLAKLSGANLWEADLSKAKLRGANLRGAKLNGADLSGADLKGADLIGAVFEPKPNSVSDVTLLFNLQGLNLLRYAISPHGLLELREAYKKAGLRKYERQVTYAINHNRRLKLDSTLESLAQQMLFEWTCNWGMSPWRPLGIMGVGLFIFTLPYLLALWSRDRETGIWLVLPPDRILGKGRKYPPYKLSHRPPFRPLPPARWARLWAKFKRLRRVLRLAFYFSLLSAFRLGWRELNVGNWISRLQKHEYVLGATGWPRFVAGFQSLLSVYLLALWTLTYFGRPFG